MANWQNLQSELERLFEYGHVYYQPPASRTMEYPAIRYSVAKVTSKHANDKVYLKRPRYKLVVMSRQPDDPIIGKLLEELPYCAHDDHYVANNLHHDVFTLYY